MLRSLATLRLLFRPRTVVPRPALATRTRAKSSVLAGVAFVVLGTLGLNAALDTVKPEWRDPEYGHRVKELRTLSGQPVVVALGSSRSQMGFSPTHLDLSDGVLVYNLSQAGCGPIQELMNLKRLLADGVTPDFVLVEILPPVMAGDAPPERLIPPAKLSLADLDRLEPFADDPLALRGHWLRERLAPWHTYRLNLLSHWGLGSWLPWQARQDFLWKQMKPRGWMPYFFAEVPPEKRADGQAKARAQYVPYFADYRIAPRPERAYRDLVELCRERGIRVAFYVMPESPWFRGLYPPHVRQEFAEYSATLGAPVFDASAWLDDEQMFADGHHLMRHGAEAFSRRFGAECLAPWLRGERR